MTLIIDLKTLGTSGRLDLSLATDMATEWAKHLGLSSPSGLSLGLDYDFSDQGLVMTGELNGAVAGPCNRCGRPTSVETVLRVRARFVEGSEQKMGERRQDEDGRWGLELDEEAGELEYYSGHHLDLANWLRDEWALGLPVSLHCGEEACREGAAEGAEPEETIDPRWQFLADLKAQMEEG